MSASRYVTVWCDAQVDGHDCGEFTAQGEHDAKDARRVARSYGWDVALPGGRDLCPRHRGADHWTEPSRD